MIYNPLMLIQKAEVKVQTAKLLACPSAESLWASDPISGEVTHGGFPVEADQRAEQRQDCLLLWLEYIRHYARISET